MEPTKYKVINDYESPYPESITFQTGERVKVGQEFTADPDWQDWVWCIGQHNNEAWVPKQYLMIQGQTGIFLRDYDARELSARVGEVLVVFEIVNAFALVENQHGENGWVPLRNMELMNK
ncbi:SH3 domain-containing protein [candidate division CSSED10-310 bacterium]|uniref:SH3 domain-containing protein n=1 Tax=candidate division CSSED10-310 bacterium TaxID=2855610 RepID=A0ABV6Z4V5_UNCC1